MLVLAIVSIFLSFLCLLYSIHISIVYNTFNKNVKNWTEELDDAMELSLNRTARRILRELDSKIDELNETKNELTNEKKEDE